MSDKTCTTLSYEEVFFLNKDNYFGYDTTVQPKAKAKERAEALLELATVWDKEIVAAKAGEKSLYFKITTGARAGTIMRLKNPEAFIRNNGSSYHYRNKEDLSQLTGPEILHHSHSWRGNGGYQVIGINSLYRGFTGSATAWFEIDGRQDISFDLNSSTLLTMKPELLIDYNGPTVWQYGKPVRSCPTMTDRFGQEVSVGDVVLLGEARTGYLMTGKITKISDKKTVWIKHIGAKEEHKEPNCHPDQLLKLKDLEQTLMIEKLKAL